MRQDDKELKSLDDLTSDLGGADNGTRSNGPCGLLLEHVQAARRGLLGSMGAEYSSSLEQATGSVACIQDKNARAEAKKLLQGLIESNNGAPRAAPNPV